MNLKNRIKLTDKENDFTIIELKESDNIKNYFELVPNIMNDDSEKNFENADIIIPQFPGGGELSIGFGSISKIYSGNIYHTVSTEYGSSGPPILLSGNLKLIDLHKKREFISNENTGTFFKSILSSINLLMEEYNLDLLMSNLKLIKKINNDSSFIEIIILKDGRLCS